MREPELNPRDSRFESPEGKEISAAPTEPGSGPGCARPAMIGCGVVLVILGVLAVLVIFKAEDVLRWGLERFEAEVERKLPDEVTEEERERLAEAFARLREVVDEGDVDADGIQRFRRESRRFLQLAPEEVTREDVWRLIEALEEAAGVRDEPVEEPAPEEIPAAPEPLPEPAG